MTADNVSEILSLPDLGGVLIGGASVLVADFDAVLSCILQRDTAFEQIRAVFHAGNRSEQHRPGIEKALMP